MPQIPPDAPVGVQNALRDIFQRLARIEAALAAKPNEDLAADLTDLRTQVAKAALAPQWRDPNDVFPGGMISKETIRQQAVVGGIEALAGGWDVRLASAYRIVLESGFDIHIVPGDGSVDPSTGQLPSSGHLGAIYLDGDVNVLGTLYGKVVSFP